jgi:hypothetical protein
VRAFLRLEKTMTLSEIRAQAIAPALALLVLVCILLEALVVVPLGLQL